MRVFALSDVHVDYPDNLLWLEQLSQGDYVDDVLLLAGDVSDLLDRVAATFDVLRPKFRSVLFVPGNHDLWVRRCEQRTSLEKFASLQQLARDHEVTTAPCRFGRVLLVPLLGWYDGTFGTASGALRRQWMDYRFCEWEGRSDEQVTDHFLELNETTLGVAGAANDISTVVSFSH
ncbi:MAG: metallophosphoesterase, partial [Pseudomonadota bacterium]